MGWSGSTRPPSVSQDLDPSLVSQHLSDLTFVALGESRLMTWWSSRAVRQSRAPNRTSPLSPLPLLAGGLMVLLAPISAGAQQPTPQQVQQALQQQPGLGDVVRSRITQSGLTPDQVRARLSASGYPSTLLDANLGGSGPVQGAPSSQELAAIQALGLPAVAQELI